MRRLALLAALIAASPALAADIHGTAQVKDGDSLYVGGREVRLYGVDVPEWHQECTEPTGDTWYPGRHAVAWLRSKVDGQQVGCTAIERGYYGRPIVVCYLDGEELNRSLVRQGWAFAYWEPRDAERRAVACGESDAACRYSGRYIPDEDDARAAGRGVWRGKCALPWVWRRQQLDRDGE